MNKREKAKAERVAREKAAIREHLITLLLGANGRQIDSTVIDDGCEVAGLGVDVFGRWLGAIAVLHRAPGDTHAEGFVGRWAFEPMNLEDWATLDKAVDKLHMNGVTP